MNGNPMDAIDACLLATTFGEPVEEIENFAKYHAKLCDTCDYSVELTLVFEKSETNKAKILQRKLESYCKKKLINIITSDRNAGFPACLNYGLTSTRAEYIIRIDTDDICSEDRLNKQIKAMKCLGVDVCYSYMKTRSGHILSYPSTTLGILRDIAMGLNPIPHPASCIKKSCLVQTGGYHEDLKRAEDFDLWLRMLLSGKYKFYCIREPLVTYSTERATEKDVENATAQIKIRITHARRSLIMLPPILSGVVVNLLRILLPPRILLLARRRL
jgi:cellulose synthase/poly-beta-1,6-N-acetylglucosamine synthase-like glycosyltransferase